MPYWSIKWVLVFAALLATGGVILRTTLRDQTDALWHLLSGSSAASTTQTQAPSSANAGLAIATLVKTQPLVKKLEPLGDWGKFEKSTPEYWMDAPSTPQELTALVAEAYQLNLPLRVRGRGHSMNGMSLPQESELLISTRNLRDFRVEEPGTITVGAGISMYSLRIWLEQRGYTLPVVNDGGAGPSVGGYLMAGGTGSGAQQYGGFWENVRKVQCVDATGKMHTFAPRDSEFRWLFGSMGQLCIITAVQLDIVGTGKEALPKSGRMSEAWEGADGMAPEPPHPDQDLYWFTLFVPPEMKGEALVSIKKLMEKYGGLLEYREPYVYPIRFRTFNPPLLYPEQSDFVAIGLWGDIKDRKDIPELMPQLEHDFAALAATPGYRRYIQSEFVPRSSSYSSYFQSDTYVAFQALKQKMDPSNLLDRGVF